MPSSTDIRNLFIKEIEHSPINVLKSVFDYLIFLKQKHMKEKNKPLNVREEQENYSTISEKKFSEIWDNDEDAVYDQFAK